MRRRYILLVLMVVSAVILAGCNKTTNAIIDYNNDFLVNDYSQTLNKVINLSTEYEEQIENDEIELNEQMDFLQQKLIPQAKQLVKIVNDLEVEDDTVQELHQLLIDAENNRLQAFEKEYKYLQDIEQEEIIEEAIEHILETDRKMDEFFEQLDKLKDEYNIEDD